MSIASTQYFEIFREETALFERIVNTHVEREVGANLYIFRNFGVKIFQTTVAIVCAYLIYPYPQLQSICE